jgi:hypothetical protein
MIHLQRKLKMKYTGSDDYLPEGVPRDKFIPVIGYEIRKTEKNVKGENKTFEDIYYIVINDNGKLSKVAEFNCVTMIDEQAEISGERLTQGVQNLMSIIKVMGEKHAQNNSKNGGGSSS